MSSRSELMPNGGVVAPARAASALKAPATTTRVTVDDHLALNLDAQAE